MSSKNGYEVLKKKIKNAKLNTIYSGKIFRYDTRGMYLLSRLRVRLSEFISFIQRGKKGYSNIEAYSIKDWFLNIMPHMLDDMISDLHGYPLGLEEINSLEDWESELKLMSYCFRQASETSCDDKYEDNEEYRHDMQVLGLNLFVRYFDNLWD